MMCPPLPDKFREMWLPHVMAALDDLGRDPKAAYQLKDCEFMAIYEVVIRNMADQGQAIFD